MSRAMSLIKSTICFNLSERPNSTTIVGSFTIMNNLEYWPSKWWRSTSLGKTSNFSTPSTAWLESLSTDRLTLVPKINKNCPS